MPLVLLALGAGLCAILMPAENRAVQQQLVGFPDSDVHAHQARPLILAALCFLPALAALAYCCGRTMDRYIIRQFAGIFWICLGALVIIWLLIDLSDNITEFRESGNILATMGKFYGTRAPAVFLLLLPYSLLLALLYSLGQLCTHREIIAMIQSGRGILRLTLPLMVTGFFFSLLSLGLNYHWAPIAEGSVDDILDAAVGKPVTEASNVLYRNPAHSRLWMIGAFPENYQLGKPLSDLEVTTTRPDDSLESRLTAKRAFWDRASQSWTFEEPVIGRFQPGQPAVFETFREPLSINYWPETPWQLIKPGLSAAYLGIPDLNSWLFSNATYSQSTAPYPYLTQWHYRWALPFTCLVTVLLATPLAIHFSRRGAGGGVFIAVVLSALLMLVSNISLALGEAGTLAPMLAAWLPNIAFTALGLYLFHRRVSGRPIYHYIRRVFPGGD